MKRSSHNQGGFLETADEMQTRPGLNSESGAKRIETREGTERGKR